MTKHTWKNTGEKISNEAVWSCERCGIKCFSKAEPAEFTIHNRVMILTVSTLTQEFHRADCDYYVVRDVLSR